MMAAGPRVVSPPRLRPARGFAKVGIANLA